MEVFKETVIGLHISASMVVSWGRKRKAGLRKNSSYYHPLLMKTKAPEAGSSRGSAEVVYNCAYR